MLAPSARERASHFSILLLMPVGDRELDAISGDQLARDCELSLCMQVPAGAIHLFE